MPWTLELLPERHSCRLDEPTDLAGSAARCDVLLEQPCGSRRSCGKCRVRVAEGNMPPTPDDRRLLDDKALADGWRLACALVVDRDITIEVPPAARAATPKSFGPIDLFVNTRIAPAEPGVVRAAHERGATPWGVAVDVGSATMAAAMIRLDTGEVCASASTVNPQVRFGADVISRIQFAREHPNGSRQLHDAVARALGDLVSRCAHGAGVSSGHIDALVCVGNPTMMHSLLGFDVTSLGEAPFEGILQGSWRGNACGLGLRLHRVVPAFVLPGIRSHVGADAVASALACGLDIAQRPKLLIDIGTNTEVVLGCRDAILCTSAAAGPAFEGATIHQGMRASRGAIEQMRIRPSGSFMLRTVGNVPAIGICGSGLIDAVAELRRAGIIESSGRMRAAGQLAADIPESLRNRIVELPRGMGRAVRLAGAAEGAVHLTANDVRQLQLVKGSIAASARVLLDRAGVAPEELDEILIAGVFGGWVRKTSAQAIGLIPAVEPERVRFMGDAAAIGARLALVDRHARDRAERIAQRAKYEELAGSAEYESAFVEALAFPELEGDAS